MLFPSSVFFRLFSIWKWTIDRVSRSRHSHQIDFLLFFLFFLQWVNYICFVLSIFCNEEPHMNSYHLKICICVLFLLSNILWKYLYFSFVAHTELLKNICFPSAKSCCPPAIIHSQIDWLVTLRWQKNLRIYSRFLTSALCDHTGV